MHYINHNNIKIIIMEQKQDPYTAIDTICKVFETAMETTDLSKKDNQDYCESIKIIIMDTISIIKDKEKYRIYDILITDLIKNYNQRIENTITNENTTRETDYENTLSQKAFTNLHIRRAYDYDDITLAMEQVNINKEETTPQNFDRKQVTSKLDLMIKEACQNNNNHQEASINHKMGNDNLQLLETFDIIQRKIQKNDKV